MSQVIKISKNTRKKISSFEIILLELFEKIIEVLTFRPVINYIENLIFIRKLALKSKFKKKNLKWIKKHLNGKNQILGLEKIWQ
jgi:hypothetical protein